MQFSDIISQAHHFRLSSDGAFITYIENKRIYIKEASLDLKNIAVISMQQVPTDVIISPNNKLISAVVLHKGLVMVYKIDGTQLAKVQDTQAGVSGVIWAPDSQHLLVFSDFMYKCSIYNLCSSTISSIRDPKLATQKGCAFTSQGKFMGLLQKHDCKDYLGIYYTADWKMMSCFQLDIFDAVEMLWAPNNAYIVVWDNCINYKLVVICPFKGIVFKYQAYDYALGIKTVQFSNNSLFLAIGSYDEKIRLFNALTWKIITQLDCSNPIINNNKIYKQDDSIKNVNRMKLVESSSYRVPSVKVVSNDKTTPNQGIGVLWFSYDDSYLVCRNGNSYYILDNMPYSVWIWCTSRFEISAIISLNNTIKMVRWSPKYNTLCIVFGTDRLLYWKNGTIMQCQFPFENRKFNIQRIIWSKDARKMLMSDKNDLVYADLVEIEDK